MSFAPETRYVQVADAEVAYHVVGDGPVDLLWFYGLGNHIDLVWDEDFPVRLHRSLASFARLIIFDRRGLGASRCLSTNPIVTWEECAADMAAVLDAVGSTQATVYAGLDAGPIAMLFAATSPERVRALVLSNTTARYSWANDYPIGLSPEVVDAFVDVVRTRWGTEAFARLIAPPDSRGTDIPRTIARRLRASGTPGLSAAHFRYILETLDVRTALSFIQAPTLIFHKTGNTLLPLEHARYLAEHIPDARLVEVVGDGMDWDDSSAAVLLDELSAFLTGRRPEFEVDRILTTLLFTDIVDSTTLAASMGDRQWHRILDSHDNIVRGELRRFRGREVNTTGDGFLASFDGPARAIRCAQEINEAVRPLGLRIRAGLHSGECEVRGDDLGGLAVHIAARIGATAGPSQILVSHTVKDLVAGSLIEFEFEGEHTLKGVPDSWKLFSVAAST